MGTTQPIANFTCEDYGALTLTHTFGRGETLHSPPLAGLKVDLDDVFSS